VCTYSEQKDHNDAYRSQYDVAYPEMMYVFGYGYDHFQQSAAGGAHADYVFDLWRDDEYRDGWRESRIYRAGDEIDQKACIII